MLVGCVILAEGLYVFILRTVATGCSDVGKFEPKKLSYWLKVSVIEEELLWLKASVMEEATLG